MTNRNNPFGEGYLTAEQREHQARAWVANSPNASAARAEILRIVSEAPIHTACLGEFGERYQIPKPVSSVVRELCGNEVSFYTARTSPTGSPALALTERAPDERYWLRFRRKGLDVASEVDGVSPWSILGIDTKPKNGNLPYGEPLATRLRIFAAFMANKYGFGTIKGMAAVCLEFKKVSGVSFSDFFDGLRPAEFMNSECGRRMFNWSWTTATPPCLNCEVRRFYNYDDKDDPPPLPDLVGAIVPIAMKSLPEDIDFMTLASRFNCGRDDVMFAYLHALKKALRMRTERNDEKKSLVSSDEAARQLLEVSRQLAAAAEKIASIAERLLSASDN